MAPVALDYARVALSALPPDEELLSPPPTAGLIASVRDLGVLEPIGVRPNGHGYAVLYGRRRIKAARAAGLETIPAMVAPGLGAVAADVAALAENAHRSANDLMALDKVRALARQGHTLEEISLAVGLSAAKLHGLLALEGLAPELRAAALDGRMAPSTAKRAARLSGEEQAGLTARLRAQGRVSAADVAEAQMVRARERLGGIAPLLAAEPPSNGARAAFERLCAELAASGAVPQEVSEAVRAIRLGMGW